MDGDEELPAHSGSAGGLARVYLQRANPIHSHRHRDISGGRRRPPDADDAEPAAAGPEIFHSTEEVTTQKLRTSKSMRSDLQDLEPEIRGATMHYRTTIGAVAL